MFRALATLALAAMSVVAMSPPSQGYDSLLFTEDFFPLIRSRLDPIKFPGKVGGHVHLIAGSNAFTADETYESAQTGTCTSGNLQIDKSNYWAPQLYYKWKNGTYSAITGDGITAYWKYPLTNTDLSAPFAKIPDDFRMLAGDIDRNEFNPANASHKAVEVLCVDANKSYDYTPYLPTDRECLTLRPQLHFPECWNGVDSYVEGNSHVAYPTDGNAEDGVCPQGFVKIPHLFMETTYHINAENIGEGYEWYPGCFVFANGDTHGFSFHGDWLNGFPSGFLVDAFTECYDSATGMITKDCQYIAQKRGAIGNECRTQGDVVNQPVGQNSAIPALPGNNPEFNSSKTSDNYPKKVDPAYVEQEILVQATDQTGGFCVGGICTDYAGGGVANPQQPAAPGESSLTSVTSAASSGYPSAPAVDASGYPVVTASATSAGLPVSEGEMTMSILPISEPVPVGDSGSTTAVPSSTAVANPATGPGGQVLVAENAGKGQSTCARRKRKRRALGH